MSEPTIHNVTIEFEVYADDAEGAVFTALTAVTGRKNPDQAATKLVERVGPYTIRATPVGVTAQLRRER